MKFVIWNHLLLHPQNQSWELECSKLDLAEIQVIHKFLVEAGWDSNRMQIVQTLEPTNGTNGILKTLNQ